MSNASDNITWNRTSNTVWTSRSERGIVATITLAAKPQPYKLTSTGGGPTGAFDTLRNAKNAFRKWLFTRPVV